MNDNYTRDVLNQLETKGPPEATKVSQSRLSQSGNSMKRSFSIRKLFQFRFRTFFAMVLAAGVLFGWIGNESVKHQRELVEIDRLINPPIKTPTRYKLVRSTNLATAPGLLVLT